MALADESGVIVESYDYDAFGTQSVFDTAGAKIDESTLGNTYGYTARRHDDEIGLIFFRARYYSPNLGQFISRDPLGFVDGMNLYAGYFALWMTVDPTGMLGGPNCQIKPYEPDPWKTVWDHLKAWSEFKTHSECQQALRDAATVDFMRSQGLLTAPIFNDSSDAFMEFIGSFLPGVGESQDFDVVMDQSGKYSDWEKRLAKASLGLNAVTFGLLPNASSFIKGADGASDIVGKITKSASDLPVVKKGTKQWDETVEAMANTEKGKINVRTESATDAKDLLSEAKGNMDRHKQYTEKKYKKGYEVHNEQNARELGVDNDLQHLKWKDGKSGGHVYYDVPN